MSGFSAMLFFLHSALATKEYSALFRSTLSAKAIPTAWRGEASTELNDLDAKKALRNLGSAERRCIATAAEAPPSYAQQAVKCFGHVPYCWVRMGLDSGISDSAAPATDDKRKKGELTRVLLSLMERCPRAEGGRGGKTLNLGKACDLVKTRNS